MYATYEMIKAYKAYPDDSKQALVTSIIPRAQQAIDTITNRTFESAYDTTKKFTVGVNTSGRNLLFYDDLCQITTIKTNADNGTGGTTLSTNQYMTLPRSSTPYYGIAIFSSAPVSWQFANDPENGIEITGRWAYSVTAPADITQACIRLTLYMLELKDSQVFDVTAIAETGQMILPKGIPMDVRLLVEPYRRIV